MHTIAIVLSLWVGLSTTTAWAIDVSPLKIEEVVSAQEPTRIQITLKNRHPEDKKIRLSTGPYRFMDPNLNIPSAEGWLSFEPNEFVLPAGKKRVVDMWVTPDPNAANAEPAEYLAALLIDEMPYEANLSPSEAEQAHSWGMTGPPDKAPVMEEGRSKITIVPRLALPVYLMVEGKIVREVVLDDFEAHLEQEDMTDLRVPALLWMETFLKNTGTVHVRPTGTVLLFDDSENPIHSASLGKGLPILPGGTLTIPTVIKLPKAPYGKRYKTIVTVEAATGELLQKSFGFEITEDKEVIMEDAS